MNSKHTIGRLLGLVVVAASLSISTATAAGNTPQGLRADGLRLQGQADRYAMLRGTTPAGLRADGLRLQGMAAAYQNRPAASFYTPQALKAEGLRWQQLARAYAQPQVSRDSGFDWGAAGIGAAGVFVLMLGAAILIFGFRRMTEEKVAV